MKIKFALTLTLALVCAASHGKKNDRGLFPDGTPIPEWFSDTAKVDVGKLGQKYVITQHGVKNDSTIIQTEQIQAVIDKAAAAGGGVIVIPKGTFLSGSLFFKQGTHLYLETGATLKGSDRIRNFKLVKTRMEGQTLQYFAALVNADGGETKLEPYGGDWAYLDVNMQEGAALIRMLPQ